MTGTNHGMTGAAIALLVKEPALAVPLSFLSHFACDAIPHSGLPPGGKLFNRFFNVTLITDFVVAVIMMVILGILFPSHKWLIWACMIAAASPDLMWAYYHLYLQKIKNRKPKLGPLARFHSWIQWSQTPKGWFVEVIWFLAVGAFILSRR
jgi:hypothetical protein